MFDDLQRSIGLQLRAIEMTEPGDAMMLAVRHNNAGNALASAWRATGDRSFGTLAAEHYTTSLDLTTEDAPLRASREHNLASTL